MKLKYTGKKSKLFEIDNETAEILIQTVLFRNPRGGKNIFINLKKEGLD